MNIIGISGLHYSVPFKKRRFPNLSARDNRIATGHDSAAVLLSGTEIMAASAEERFSREKGTGAFPVSAVRFCLERGNLTWADVDYVAHGFAYEPVREFFMGLSDFERQRFEEVYSEAAQLRTLGEFLPEEVQGKFRAVPHHVAHAASAFYPSGFEESLILVSDGMGEIHSSTVAIGSENGIEILRSIPSLHSLGMLYSIVTLHLGFFMSSDEYKVMGLAPYGDARKTLPIFEELIRLQPDGSYTIPCLVESGTDLEQETLSQSRRYLESRLGPPRELEEELTQYHMDIAAGMQVALQNALLHLLRASRKETGLDRLCLAGGVALNCVANGVISRSGLFKQLFVQPAAGDDGTSLGAAMHVHRTLEPKAKYPRMRPPFLGPEYSDEAIQEAILKHPKCEGIRHAEETTLLETAARAIDEGKVVAWFQGRMEFGPRALGARSILANPAIPTMREHVNALVKKRENFRPFAPAVLAERAARIFHVKEGAEEMYENMLFVTQVREEFRAKLPSITHVDGSARVQVVPRDSNALFYRLISKLEEINGMPVVLNTSFNVKGQPIVCSPAEAVETFLAANLDMLVIGLFVVIRKS